jgi:hypothetical protein
MGAIIYRLLGKYSLYTYIISVYDTRIEDIEFCHDFITARNGASHGTLLMGSYL